MLHNHTLQTSAAFDRLEDALLGKTDDVLWELIEELEYLLYKAKDIHNTAASFVDGSDYEPTPYCNLPSRY
jgi:hypothetical protein